ncbi:hypothetical protein [Halostella pelagica]|uniref:hypothetical protein n=1 Tax=Halostella pelagica TaxID=2583824 RepID=UPI001081AA05|nr:hypothetical protein [Halostella pelagica]
MDRRAFLTALAAGTSGLAGCSLSTGNGDSVPTNDGTRTTGRPTDDGETGTRPDDHSQPEGWASVVELETGPRTYAFGPTSMHTDDRARIALWFDRTATADHPARLRGWFENGNDFANTFRIEWIPVVGGTHGRQPAGYDHEARLHFAPTENNDLAETVPEVIRTDDGYWRVKDIGPWMTETYRMDPGERVELEYVLVGERGMSGRPTGTYEYRGDDQSASVTVWNTDAPGPEAKSRFAGRSVPAFDNDRTVQWFHEADSTTPAFVRPSAERIELDGRIDFEMVNNSHEELGCGHWNLYKLVDGRWFHVCPAFHTADCRSLPPGGREQWSLRAFNGEAVPCGHENCGCRGLTQGYLGGGEYAVVAGYGHPADESAALVELTGDPVTLVPTDDATAEQNGNTVTVTTDRYGDGEHPPDATFAVTRTVSATERVIAEQVMGSSGGLSRGRGLRNALSAMTADVDRVVVRTDEHVANAVFGSDESTRRFRFRGEDYEVSRDAAAE